MKYLSLLVLFLLAACSEKYRYPCQNPNNWEEKQCKRPYCSANGTCPDDLTPYEKDKVGGLLGPLNFVQPVQQNTKKGECK